jgi:predicted RNA-binding protein YlxR (DUF448 family)
MKKQKHVPLRTCIACRKSRPKRELVRVVLLPTGDVIVDEAGKQNGRGAYLCPDPACWEAALKRGGLGRALRVPLPAQVTQRLTEYAQSLEDAKDAN